MERWWRIVKIQCQIRIYSNRNWWKIERRYEDWRGNCGINCDHDIIHNQSLWTSAYIYGRTFIVEQWECTALYRLFSSVDNRSDRWQVYLSSGRRVDEKRHKATWLEKGRFPQTKKRKKKKNSKIDRNFRDNNDAKLQLATKRPLYLFI